jgi:hypothetical protein
MGVGGGGVQYSEKEELIKNQNYASCSNNAFHSQRVRQLADNIIPKHSLERVTGRFPTDSRNTNKATGDE